MPENKFSAERTETEKLTRIKFFYEEKFVATLTIRPDRHIHEKYHYTFHIVDRAIDKLDLSFGEKLGVKENIYKIAGIAIRTHERNGYAVLSGVKKIKPDTSPEEEKS